MKDDGLRLLTPSLPRLPSLIKLVLRSNQITDASFADFAAALSHLPALAHLDLSWNELTNQSLLPSFHKILPF